MSRSHFDAIAAVYDDTLPGHVVEHYLTKRARFVTAHCPRGSGLDVGCGTGALTARLAAAGYPMIGVDPSPGMLAVLRGRASEVGAIVASGTALPFTDDRFALVLSVASLHHVATADSVRRTLGEMVRVVRPGGRIVVWDHNPRNPYWRSLMPRVPQDTGDERLIPEAELIAGILGAGGEVLLARQLGMVPDFTPRPGLRLAAAGERLVEATPLLRRFAAHNVILATKQAGLPRRPAPPR